MPKGKPQTKNDQLGASAPLLSLARLLARQAAAEHIARQAVVPSSSQTPENEDGDHGQS